MRQLKNVFMLFFLLLVSMIVLLNGCSGNSNISPITPDKSIGISDVSMISDSDRDPAYSEIAEEVLSTIFLGRAVDPQSGKVVDGFAIIHPRRASAKPNPPNKPVKPSSCYGFLANGAKWKSVEPWILNATNHSGLSENLIFNNFSYDIEKWEDAADGTIDNNISNDILGDGALTMDELIADTVQPDGLNEAYFGYLSDPGTIAVTIIWGVFLGPPSQRQLVEWDQVYNLVYPWSLSGEAEKMDFENIATHELGHSVGLADLYDLNCSNETMYGYADYGETNKRTLEAGDIAGVKSLYN